MEEDTTVSDFFTFDEEEFEGCLLSQDEDEIYFVAAGTRRNTVHNKKSSDPFEVKDFTHKYPGCFSMEYQRDIFEGVEHSSCSNKHTSNTNTFQSSSPESSTRMNQEQQASGSEYSFRKRESPKKGQPYDTRKLYEEHGETFARDIYPQTLDKRKSLEATEAEYTNAHKINAKGREYDTEQSNDYQYAKGKEEANEADSPWVCKGTTITTTTTTTQSYEPDHSGVNRLTRTWDETHFRKVSHALCNKVQKKKISPKKLLEAFQLQSRNRYPKGNEENVNISIPSQDMDKWKQPGSFDTFTGVTYEAREGQTAPRPSEACGRFSEWTPTQQKEKRRSAPPLLNSCNLSVAATSRPSASSTEDCLPYQSSEDDWLVSWNRKSSSSSKSNSTTTTNTTNTAATNSFVVSEIPETKLEWRKPSHQRNHASPWWFTSEGENEATTPENVNTLCKLKKRSHDEKQSVSSWRKSPRKSLDWPPRTTTTTTTASYGTPKEPSKYLNVSPTTWRRGADTPSSESRTQPLSKFFQSYSKANFDDKGLLVKSFPTGIIDTHCHLDFLLERIRHNGSFYKFRMETKDSFPKSYEGCVTIFCRPETFGKISWWESMISEGNIWCAFGCHPHFADRYGDKEETDLQIALMNSKTVALGEIGLDYYKKCPSQFDTQKLVFRRQLLIAHRLKKPVIIHCRDAHKDCMDIIKEILPLDYRIHLHCFTGSWSQAEEWLETFSRLFLGVTNLINNYKDLRSYQLQRAVKRIPLNRLLLETDAPYFRPAFLGETGQHSHPGMALYVAAQVAYLKEEELQVVLAHARHNTRLMYGI